MRTAAEELAHEAIALLWDGDDPRVARLVDREYRDHSATMLHRGPESLRAERRALREAFADVEVSTRELIVSADHAVARLRFRGLHVGRWAGIEPSRRSVEWDEIHIWRFRDGRLVEHWACRDDLAALCRLGAVIRWEEGASELQDGRRRPAG
ncbi:MAG TPA: ester cyclase [Thermoleophilaceae bacterium]|nr:ester cyclase [Thermoleophilaceae bacterium]